MQMASVQMAMLLAACGVSCLPSSDLSSYSSPPRSGPAEPLPAQAGSPDGAPTDGVDGASGGVSPEASGSSATGGEAAEPVAAPFGSDCSGECGAPVLVGSGDQNGAALGSDAQNAPDAGGALGEAADAGAAPSCVPGATLGPNQRCYLLLTTPSSWQDARQLCQNQGNDWDLATVHGLIEDVLVTLLLGRVSDAWLGASDLGSEGNWRWLGDTSAFWNGTGTGSRVGNAYVNWNSGTMPEPNGGANSDCLRLQSGGGWADLECMSALASVCEGPRL
ncbi:MAG: C-type lectin domain-containing protein [Deltaproteobacteria bacterium]